MTKLINNTSNNIENNISKNIKFNNKNIRIVGTIFEPFFIVKDICTILQIKNVTDILQNIPDKWKSSMIVQTKGGKQHMSIVNEPGLYKIIMRSNKEIAQPFQDFICEEILPSIRKNGEYKMNEKYIEILKEKEQIEQEKKSIENKNNQLVEQNNALSKKISGEFMSEKNRLIRDRYEENKTYVDVIMDNNPKKAKKNILLLPTKPCNNCNLKLPLESFNSANTHRDKHENVCIICRKKRNKEVLEEKKLEYENITELCCNICNITKELKEFYKDKNSPSGHMRRCKLCHKQKQLEARQKPKMEMIDKLCTCCNIVKPKSEYHQRLASNDGYSIYCKPCTLIKSKIQYEKHKEKYLETKKIKRQNNSK
jgi:prophage antirepressor-like protein